MHNLIRCLTVLAAVALFAGNARADQPKTYRITLSDASRIGSTDLKAGEYKLVVDSAKVQFTDVKTGEAIEMKAKIETVDEKFERTMVHSTRAQDGAKQISEIRLGGSKTKIAFD